MENLIINLINKLSTRKVMELSRMEQYKENKELVLVSSGKVLEIENLIRDLEEIVTCHIKIK